MQIQVSGKQIDIGQALQEYVREELNKSVTKYFERAVSADVIFSKESYQFKADILVNEGTGIGFVIKGFDTADDIYTAFDGAMIKIVKQLRRYKDKIKDHKKHKVSEVLDATKYVINTKESEMKDNPVIIAEKPAKVPTLSVSEAVMQMDLMNVPALLFKNSQNGRINVVYYRVDGNISWVDSGK